MCSFIIITIILLVNYLKMTILSFIAIMSGAIYHLLLWQAWKENLCGCNRISPPLHRFLLRFEKESGNQLDPSATTAMPSNNSGAILSESSNVTATVRHTHTHTHINAHTHTHRHRPVISIKTFNH